MDFIEINTPEDEMSAFHLLRQLRQDITEQEYLERLHAAKEESRYRLLGLQIENQLVALMGYRILTDFVHGRHLYIDDLVVDQNLRNKGFGKAMLERAKQIAKESHCQRLRLCTGNQNLEGMAFYQKVGWDLKAVVFKTRAE